MTGFDPEFIRRQRELARKLPKKVDGLRDLVATADLIADVDSSVPDIVIPERLGRITMEALDYAFRSLGIEPMLVPLWVGVDRSRWLTAEASAEWSEKAAVILCDWLRDHGVPKLALWIPSRVAQDWVSIEWTASA